MRIWIESSYKNVFQDALCNSWSDFEAELTMAQNERESFQILMRADQNFIIRSVIFFDLKSAGGNIIKGENLSYGFVEYEYLSRNSKESEEKAWVRKAPGYFPDPISNSRSISVNPKVTQPIWVTLYTPKDTIPDTYEGEIKINTSLGEFFVNIKAEVCPVIIPDACESKFKFIVWQQILSTTIYREYGYKKYTKEWWEVVSDIADKMAENRINDLYVSTQNLLLDGGTYIDENGNYVFNWSKFDEYIEFFRKRNIFKILIGDHLTSCDYRTLTHPLVLIKSDENGKLVVDIERDWANETSVHWLNEFLPALEKHLEELGVIDIWYQHIGDECFTEEQMRNYIFLCKKMQELCPKIKYGDAVMDVKHADEQVNLGVKFLAPLEDSFEKDIEYYKAKKAEGIEMFPYSCCGPIGDWFKSFIDLPCYMIRSFIWRIFSTGSDGYLLWSLNYWDNCALGENDNLKIDETEFKGDEMLIHPDPYSNKVKSSIRLNNIRDGAEEFELLSILKEKDPEYALSLAEKIVKHCNGNYLRDTKQMAEIRKELVYAASGKINSDKKAIIDERVLAGKID